MPRKISDERWRSYVLFRNDGAPRDAAAQRAGAIDYAAACAFDRGDPRSSGYHVWVEMCEGRPLWQAFLTDHVRTITGKTANPLAAEMRRAFEARQVDRITGERPDIAQPALDDRTGRLFRERYFGRIMVHWHDDVWAQLWDRFEHGRRSGDRQFVVVNCPPGGGKSTLMQDFEGRVIVEDRSVRIGNFSIASKTSVGTTNRLRRHLERTSPVRANPLTIAQGTARDADACLLTDFGAFKPLKPDLWTREAFTVAQDDGELADDKEPTVAAWGFDQQYIGTRLTFINADDMVDRTVTRNAQVMENQQDTWDTETEARLEQGGLLVLIGQRLSADDLYRYCLKQTIPVDDDEDVDVIDARTEVRRYHHIVYPAHDETRCVGIHKKTEARPWPDGCLLDPKRLSWPFLRGVQARNPGRYATVFQQTDTAPGDSLVDEAWVDGGIDHAGNISLGCWDDDRSVWQAPPNPDGLGIVTVDPSSTKWWAIQGWWYQEPLDPTAAATFGGRRMLLGLENVKLDADSLLGMNLETREFYGSLEDMRRNYETAGLHLDAVVVEANHAQRFLLQLATTWRWAEQHGVALVAHQTGSNKWDPKIGVTTIADHWRHGRVRLPGRTPLDREHVRPLTRQVTTWPRSTITDQVMANWFLEVKLPSIPRSAPSAASANEWRPSWLKG